MIEPVESIALVFLGLVWIHLIMDYALQGNFMAKGKNPETEFYGVPWRTLLSSHAFLHAFPVAIITGSWLAGLGELIAHWGIDRLKCSGKITFNQDQMLHLVCKAIWTGFFVMGIP